MTDEQAPEEQEESETSAKTLALVRAEAMDRQAEREMQAFLDSVGIVGVAFSRIEVACLGLFGSRDKLARATRLPYAFPHAVDLAVEAIESYAETCATLAAQLREDLSPPTT